MTTRRTAVAAAVAGAAPFLFVVLAAAPAAAHGAPVNPVSRAAACGAEGGRYAQSQACKAAVAAGGTEAVDEWDNLRVADVGGRDGQVIPDGKLCSAGIDQFRGLDLARADWPATRLSAGGGFTFTYRGTIPHKGTFRLYMTKDGYDPSRRLTWSDLEPKPFLTATDPPLERGSYRFEGALPPDKTGRHLIYTIWQNSDTPDTYYSCSDVIFGTGAGTRADRGSGTGAGTGTDRGTAAGSDTVVGTGGAAAQRPAGQGGAVVLAAGGVAALVLVAGTAAVIRRRRA